MRTRRDDDALTPSPPTRVPTAPDDAARGTPHPRRVAPAAVMALQRSAGNAAVAQLLHPDRAAGGDRAAEGVGGAEADGLLATLTDGEAQAATAAAAARTALTAAADGLRESVGATAAGARARVGAAFDGQASAVLSATGEALRAIEASRLAEHQTLAGTVTAERARLRAAHAAERAGGPQTIAAAKTRTRAAGDAQAQRAVADSQRRADAIRAEAAGQPGQGAAARAEAQATAGNRIAGRAAEQCLQTGQQVAASVRAEASQHAARNFDGLLAEFTRAVDRGAQDAGTALDRFAGTARARIDEIAAGAAGAVRALGREGLVSLRQARAGALGGVGDWERQTLPQVDDAAARAAGPLDDGPAGAAGDLRRSLSGPIEELRALTDPAAVASGAGRLRQAIGDGHGRLGAAVGGYQATATAHLHETFGPHVARFAGVTAGHESGASQAGQALVGKLAAARGDAVAGMQQASGDVRRAFTASVDGAAGELTRAGNEFRAQVQRPADDVVAALTRMVDDALASEDALLATTRGRFGETRAHIGSRYDELRAEGDRRSAEATSTTPTAARPVQRSWWSSLTATVAGWVADVQSWFARTFGEFWGGLLFGVLAGLVIVLAGVLLAYVIGAAVALVASATTAAIVAAVALVAGAVVLGVYNRFQEFAEDNPGTDPSEGQSQALVALGIADLTGIPYLVEGLCGQRAFGKELHGFERGERIGMGLAFLVAAGASAFRGVRSFLSARGRPPIQEFKPGEPTRPEPARPQQAGPEPSRAGYRAVDDAVVPAGLEIIDPAGWPEPADIAADGTITLQTQVRGEGRTGWVERAYNPRTRQFEMRNAFLDDIPEQLQWIEVGGEKMRLQAYLTLRQMRLFEIRFGEVRVVKMSTIQNIKALIQLHILRQHMPIEQAILKTHSVSYGNRAITPAGELILSARIEGDDQIPLGLLMEHFEQGKPAKIAYHDQLLREYAGYGVTRETVVLYNYDIYLEVLPVEPPLPAVGAPVPVRGGDEQRDPDRR